MEENKKKNIIIGVMACIIVLLLAALIYFVFIKKDDSKPIDNNVQVNTTQTITVKKSLRVFYFDVLLDINGNVYLAVRDDDDGAVAVSDKLVDEYKNATKYSYDNKEVSLLKVDVKNIKDIQSTTYGNGGGSYISLFDQNDKLYVLDDFDVMDSANLKPLTNDSLNKVSKVYSECDEEGCLVYADAIIGEKTEKISLYDLFETVE